MRQDQVRILESGIGVEEQILEAEVAAKVALVFAGVAANETLGHWILGIWGTHLFPMKFLGMTVTQEFNWLAMGLWPLVLLLCIYLGWRRGATG